MQIVSSSRGGTLSMCTHSFMKYLGVRHDRSKLENIGMCSLSRSLKGLSRYKGWKCTGSLPLQHICQWYGVQCNEDAQVIGLYLNQISISGTISSQINHLHQLQVLIMSENQIYGTIPKFQHLHHLQVLDLHDNAFQGDVHPSVCELDNLRRIDFSLNSNLQFNFTCDHYFSGIPKYSVILNSYIILDIFTTSQIFHFSYSSRFLRYNPQISDHNRDATVLIYLLFYLLAVVLLVFIQKLIPLLSSHTSLIRRRRFEHSIWILPCAYKNVTMFTVMLRMIWYFCSIIFY